MPSLIGVKERVHEPQSFCDQDAAPDGVDWSGDERTSLEESPAKQGETQGEAGACDPLVAEGGRADEAG